ncbi:hypothetical protein Leryth_005805 [Lithospermum erythrorhizon]|nr:hypothetical protein Leryth_005805 [Lithospermum erythrorhizon]
MSRCFPFPPPGYVKTPRPEEDLFQEEKPREKKHKKEKKSKRKKEGDDKEERNKDRDKRKEKKEKKDKHRDKKDKEKIKGSVLDDATTAAKPGTSDRDNARTRELCSNPKNRSFSENKLTSAFQFQNGWSLTDNRLVRESDESKFVQELGRRIKDEGKAIGSRTIERPSSSDRRGYEEMQISAATGGLRSSAKNMEFERDQGVDPKKVEGKELKDGLRFNGNNTIPNLTGPVDLKVEMPPEPVQRVVERTVQEKDKCKEKSEEKRGEKRKDRDKKEKKSHGKDKGRDKIKKKDKDEEKRREETEKQRTEYQKTDPDRSKELNRNEHSSFNKNINVYSSQVDNNIVFTEEKVKKRKDVETNGFAHENEIRSNSSLKFDD